MPKTSREALANFPAIKNRSIDIGRFLLVCHIDSPVLYLVEPVLVFFVFSDNFVPFSLTKMVI